MDHPAGPLRRLTCQGSILLHEVRERGALAARDAATLRDLWTRPVQDLDPQPFLPRTADRILLTGLNVGHALQLQTGEEAWRYLRTEWGEWATTDGLVVAGFSQSRAVALDETGRELWRASPGSLLGAGGGRAFFAGDGALIALHPPR